MNWQDKLAILKMAGYELKESDRWRNAPKSYYRYICDTGPSWGVGDTKAQAVDDAWEVYMREVNDEKVSWYQ